MSPETTRFVLNLIAGFCLVAIFVAFKAGFYYRAWKEFRKEKRGWREMRARQPRASKRSF